MCVCCDSRSKPLTPHPSTDRLTHKSIDRSIDGLWLRAWLCACLLVSCAAVCCALAVAALRLPMINNVCISASTHPLQFLHAHTNHSTTSQRSRTMWRSTGHNLLRRAGGGGGGREGAGSGAGLLSLQRRGGGGAVGSPTTSTTRGLASDMALLSLSALGDNPGAKQAVRVRAFALSKCWCRRVVLGSSSWASVALEVLAEAWFWGGDGGPV